jgi:hypothetical protein
VTSPFLDESYFGTVTLLQLHCQMVLPLHPHVVVDPAAVVLLLMLLLLMFMLIMPMLCHHRAETSCLCYLKMRRDEKGAIAKAYPVNAT